MWRSLSNSCAETLTSTTCQPLIRIALDEAIRKLAPGYRAVFILHDVEGYEHSQISEMLGCSVGTSKSQLHKARMKLRKLLSKRISKNDKSESRVQWLKAQLLLS
jgi:DNA-directed RNA polymerase specialized sigma24 family protein